MRQRIAAAGLLIVVVVAMAGCAMDDGVSNLTLEQAKAVAQSREAEIVASLPAEVVVSVDQTAQGSLLSCRGERNYRWAGSSFVALADEADPQELMDDLHAVYSARPDWRSSRETSFDEPEVILDHVEGDGYLVGVSRDPLEVEIFSFSPCFHLPEDRSPHGFF